MKLTIEDIKKLGPCYDDDKLEKVFAGREYLTSEDIPSLTISKGDIFWVLSHYLPDPRAFARRVALDVVHLWECPRVVLEWLKTGDGGLRVVARDAARNAARAAGDAAEAAAWAPARDAARDAARAAGDAAGAAAWAAGDAAWAARDAAEAAARAAAEDAAWDKYISWAIEEIEK